MIKIDRSTTPAPEKLLADGPVAKAAIAALLAKQGDDALESGHFDGDVYASAPVKEALWEMQHHKCCFCEHAYERKFSTVEHFRPKTRVARSRPSNRAQKQLGYWWLAYEFENLYFCCSNCNTPKGDYFPLGPGAAALPQGALASAVVEDALLLDPGNDQPEDHITFQTLPDGTYRIAPRNGSARGRETIEAAKLDRDDLDELRDAHRRIYLDDVAALFAEVKGSEHEARALGMARRLCARSSPFALLARTFFRDAGVL
ncbi:MAG: hypothetical protein AB7S26_29310 [Sandaracinaceae bacterium]